MMPQRGETLVKALSMDPRRMLRASIGNLRRYNTRDSQRLVAKLDSPDAKHLMASAEKLLQTEGTLVEYEEVDVKEIRHDLDLLLDIQLRREDIVSWVKDYKSYLQDHYTFNRLDWLWDFSWTYMLWGPKRLQSKHILVYGAILGRKPARMGSVPFQAALNRYRKDLIHRYERDVFLAAKSGDYDTLLSLGLTTQQADLAIGRVVRASV